MKDKNATFASNGMLLLFVVTLVGLLWSRALLSLVHIAWLIVAVAFVVKKQFLLSRNPLLIWSVIPLGLFLFGVYQEPLAKANYDYLLTLSMYPIAAIATSILFKAVDKQTCPKVWTGLAAISLLLPLVGYFSTSGMYELYGSAKTLPVLMSADHIRYGLFIAASFLFLLSYKLFETKVHFSMLLFIFLMLVLISVRTAWVAAAIIIVVSGWQKIKLSKYPKVRWLIPLLLTTFSVGAYYLVDAVKGKVDYTIYDWQSFDEKKFEANFSDGVRRSINYVGFKTVTTDDHDNVGWSAIPVALQNGFNKYFPTQQIEYGWPFNQWLFWWIGAGWWTMILFSIWMLYPLVWAFKTKNHSLASWTLVIAASCVVECTLSLQYGVFLHAWVTAFLWLLPLKEEYGS
ncbi:MAG TPA: hypothetical protein VF622_16170 [Segetibacter sp.]